jgi:Tol biopolymer transport system component
MRSYFPSLASGAGRVFAIPWIEEESGRPHGPAPIVSAALDGSGLRELPRPPDVRFIWTPVVTDDGAWVFYSDGSRFAGVEEDVDIWKVRTDGSGPVNLTRDSDANDAFPDVSRDGSRVVFRSYRDAEPGSGRDGNKEIYVMDGEGGGLRRVTHHDGNDTMPAISPDGRWVVYTTDRAGNGLKLWMQSLEDPEDQGRLLEPERAHLVGLDMHPRFSPDGAWIVFTSDRAGYMDEWPLSGLFPQPYGELFAVPIDGSHPAVRLTHDKWEDALPFWSEVVAGEAEAGSPVPGSAGRRARTADRP